MAMGPLTKAFRILDEWLTGLVRSQQEIFYLLLGRRMLKAARFFISFSRRTTPVDPKTTPEKTLGSEWSEILGFERRGTCTTTTSAGNGAARYAEA